MRYLVVRIGAYGDNIIITPLIRYLKTVEEAEVYVLTSEQQGGEIFIHNPRIDKLIFHKKDSIDNSLLGDYFKSVAQAHECDKVIDLCESIEMNLALHPNDPRYKYPKYERQKLCDKNFYEETFDYAGIKLVQIDFGNQIFGMKREDFFNPEMFFTEEENTFMADQLISDVGKFKIVWGLSGSSRQKVYPVEYILKVVEYCQKNYKDIVFYTVGDEICQVLEYSLEKFSNVRAKSGVWKMRQSILACKHADIVISPDTGLLHGAGCFNTPKIGLISSNTINNLTKYFIEDYSIQAEGVSCAPCFYLIYNAQYQSQMAGDGMTPLCMAHGISYKEIIRKIDNIYVKQTAPKA